jgi:hypothetical protein
MEQNSRLTLDMLIMELKNQQAEKSEKQSANR